ncbi:ribosome biogenesis GTPase A [Mycoplasma testudineum]|uniref:Ribosome biogenesis GTPase A n=1 Tax=Mycoplasma testudineum TaxID=244584 RepID=A0A4R6IGH6_9MOLU|nr:ribosome biogenesis GTPase YlqF [Mycoplasma testudineum]OYD27072.1 ribosome biogenesis GTPase YlqF [Mycoplasma testudineum]TDO21174.1 ribosome biogenesis GTPase A [Mycoplasma testudineum]
MKEINNQILEQQNINWYPGHMAKALRQLKEKAVICDLFIVVLDSRAPISTYNDIFDKIEPNKPRLFIFSKSDLGDKSKIEKLKNRFSSKDNLLVLNLKKENSKKIILSSVEKLLAPKRLKDKKKGLLKPRLRIFVIGVPNSGKSTLINILSPNKKVKIGNMPGITKSQQWINIGDYQLLDTPGMLWPKFDDQLIAIKLMIIGSIKKDVISINELFETSFKLVSKYYPEKIKELNLTPCLKSVEIYNELVKLAINLNMLTKSGLPDVDKARNWFYETVRNWKGVTYD